MKKDMVRKFFLDQSLSIMSVGVALFWSAGSMDWLPGWAVIAVWLAYFATTDYILLRVHPDLLEERLKPPKDSKTWDKVIVSTLRLLQLVRYILAGLDQRHHWSVGIPVSVQVAGLVVCVLSYALLAWAMASNNFFSQVVRIQADRSHTVATGGPYRWVRHPSYAGMIFFELGMGFLLASWWALGIGGMCAILIIVRTALEDRTLRQDLAGYAEYAGRVRYRLLPGIW